jgi:hypothetical protein
MITVVIPYTGNKVGLAQLIMSLQPQLHPDDDIYVVDNTPDRSSLPIAKQYGSNRCYIFVEVTTEKDKRFMIQKGLQSMKENKHGGALIIEPGCVISTTFIANLKRAARQDLTADFLSPFVSEPVDGVMDPNFKFFCPPTTEVADCPEDFLLSHAISFVRERAVNDEDYTVDLLRDIRVGVFVNELVVVLSHNIYPSSSI